MINDRYEKFIHNLIELTDNHVIEWKYESKYTIVYYVTIDNLMYCFIHGLNSIALSIFVEKNPNKLINTIIQKNKELTFASSSTVFHLLATVFPSLHKLHLSIINQHSSEIFNSCEDTINSKLLSLRAQIDSRITRNSNIL